MRAVGQKAWACKSALPQGIAGYLRCTGPCWQAINTSLPTVLSLVLPSAVPLPLLCTVTYVFEIQSSVRCGIVIRHYQFCTYDVLGGCESSRRARSSVDTVMCPGCDTQVKLVCNSTGSFCTTRSECTASGRTFRPHQSF